MTPNLTAQPKAAYGPRLLIQWEPAYRVFLSNLADTFLFRSVPRLQTTTIPGPFWKDVFVSTGIGWGAFLESMLWHTLGILAMWTLSQQPSLQPMQRHSDRLQASYLYYQSPVSFPARGSSPRALSQHSMGRFPAGRRSVIAVAPERKHAAINAPQMRFTKPGSPGIALANSAPPMMPLSATRHSQLILPPSQDWVVPPVPAVNQGTSRWTGLAQVSVVAPPPNVAAGSARRGIAGPSLAVVAPPPNVQRGSLRIADINIGHSEVVAPAPQLPMHEQSAIPGLAQGTLGNAAIVPPPPSSAGLGKFGNGRGAVLARAGLSVVPPPPTITRTSASSRGGTALADASGSAFSASGLHVVPPPPTVQGAGSSAGDGPGSTLSRVDFSVVPPPPAVQGVGGSSSRGRGSGSALSGTGLPVVPPPPAVQALAGSTGSGRGTGGGRAKDFSGAGFSVVPPAPSVQGIGSSPGSGHGNGLSPGFSGVGPAPSLQPGANSEGGASGSNSSNGASISGASAGSDQGTGKAAADERLMAMDVRPPVGPLPPLPPLVVENPRTAGEELPLRVIGLALALPNSSYFSNYEVYLAERWLGKGETELIKLVYVFLPYQQRLSEYRLDESKVYKVRVTRDPSCDESFMEVAWPESEAHAQLQQSNGAPASAHSRHKDTLSCYRTTADDYRKAVSRPARPAKIHVESKPGS